MSGIVVAVIGVLIVPLFVPAFAAILRLPSAILIPLIIYVCAVGAYAVNNSTTVCQSQHPLPDDANPPLPGSPRRP